MTTEAEATLTVPPHVASRFSSKFAIDAATGCWRWTAAVDRRGYGKLGLRGSKTGKAHRISFMLHNGVIPQGMLVCHSSDTPSCVNPAHLFLGTTKDNVADMLQKGRAWRQGQFRTHCMRGHEVSPENTYYYQHSHQCRTCSAIRWRARQARKPA